MKWPKTKIDGPESNVINHLSSMPQLIFNQTRGSNHKFSANTLNLFDGKIGLMKGEVSITLKDDARPYQAPIRRVAQAMEKPLKDELDRLVHEGILVKMDPDEPSDWLNKLHMCEETQW